MAIASNMLGYLKTLMSDDKRRLKQFSVAAVVFFSGCSMVYWANNNLPPSLEQELAALLFITISLCAFAWAILLQLLYIASKLFK